MEEASSMSTIVTDSKAFCQCSLPTRDTAVIAAPSEQDWKVTLWDLESRKVVASTQESKERLGMVMCIKMCGDCRSILAAYENGSIVAYDVRNGGAPVSTASLYTEPIMCMDFDETFCANKGICGSVNNELCVFERDKDKLCERKRVMVTNDGFCSLHVRPDGRIVASGGWDGRVRVFGWKTLKPLAVLDIHKESVQAVRFSENNLCKAGLLLAAGSKDRTVSLWSLYS